MNIDHIYFRTQLEKWAHSAWINLDLTPPADLSRVCCHLNIEYCRTELSYGVYGIYTESSDGHKRIFIASALPIEQQRIVWAHEIGHALISRGLTGELEYRYTIGNKNNKTEQECDRFALHLLMPEMVLREEAKRLGHSRKNNRLGTLAAKFGVTTEDMIQRLRQIGI